MDKSITYNNKSFIINGEKVFLNSASIHYFRIPREEWREVLVKAKLAGMNCIDTYIAWNFHEEEEGSWNFTGDRDIDHFFKLCKELDLWVIVRPGPFICAEWDFGGLPYWIGNKDAIELRTYNETFLHYVDLYFDKIMPIISSNQITKDGSVIMVQIENEYDNLVPEETKEKEMYLNHLKKGTLDRGIDVQLVVCNGNVEGAVSCINFWSGADYYSSVLKKNHPDYPLFNTEFWTGWFENWGANKATQKTADLLEKRIMEMVRAGYTGFNQYMFFGGTNFGSWGGRTVNNSDIYMVTSYDYDSPLNEYASVTPKYYRTKKLGYFVNTVAQFLIEAEEVKSEIRASGNCTVRERRNNDERMYFVESKSDERGTCNFTTEDGRNFEVTVNPGQIAPVVADYILREDIRMTYNSFFSFYRNLAGEDILLVYGDKGQRSKLKLTSQHSIGYEDKYLVISKKSDDNKTIEFDLCHFEDIQELNIKANEKTLKVLVVDSETMDKTWLAKSKDNEFLIIGCDDVNINDEGRISIRNTKQDSATKVYGTASIEDNLTIFSESINKSNYKSLEIQTEGSIAAPKLPKLQNWLMSKESLNFDNGKKVEKPEGFTEYGKGFGYLLYSIEVDSCCDRKTNIVMPHIQDTVRIYVNGIEQGVIRDVITASAKVSLKAGRNVIQLLVQNMGRYNYSHFLGEEKGLSDKLYLDGTVEDIRSGWKLQSGEIVNLNEILNVPRDSVITREFENDGFDRAILTGSVSENIWVNGKKIDMGKYQQGWHFISVDISKYLVKGKNSIEMKYYRSNIVRLDLSMFKESNAIENYYINDAAEYDDLKEWTNIENINGNYKNSPVWYKCKFPKPDMPQDMNLKLKLRMTGMGKGFIWLNGINLGRFWQIGPQEDYKVPVAWLKDENELVIFDEEGRLPSNVKLLWEESSKGKWF